MNTKQLKKIYYNKIRDLRETQQRVDTIGSELKRKDKQIRELQHRLESSEGCKSKFLYFSIFNKKKFFLYIFLLKIIYSRILFNVW